MTAAWALLIILSGVVSGGTAVPVYFANRDMCEAAREKVLADLGELPPRSSLRCHLVSIPQPPVVVTTTIPGERGR